MKEEWRIYICNLGDPSSKDKKTRVVRNSAEAARTAADYINRKLAKEHGDGVYQAYIASSFAQEHVEKVAPKPPLYHLYDDIGRPKGTYNEEAARQKLEINENWTMAEVK